MPAYWIYVIGLRKWWNFYDTLMWPLMGNYVKCVNIAFASTQHVSITSKRRNLTMWPFALLFLMFWVLRQKLQSLAKPVDILNDVGPDIFDHQLCYISDAGANVAWLSSIELGSQAELYFQIPSGSLWIVLLPLALNCGWFFNQVLQSVFALPCLCHLQGVFYCSALKIR